MTPNSGRVSDGVLFTDQYQLTMAQLYYRRGLHERMAQFDYYFRRYPDYGRHQAGYAVFAGLDPLLQWMSEVKFTKTDLAKFEHAWEQLPHVVSLGAQKNFAKSVFTYIIF